MKKYKGLTTQEVLLSRKRHGSNELKPPVPIKWWQLLLKSLTDRTIIILFIAALISLFINIYTNEPLYESIGILIAISIAIGVGFYSEFKSQRAFYSLLKESENIKVKIFRDGKFGVVPIGDVVVGDIIIIEAGDKVPCDGKLLEFIDFTVDSSSITGESEPLYPTKGDEIYRGYIVNSGTGIMKATAVGPFTQIGKIRDALSNPPEPTPLQERLKDLADKIGLGGSIGAIFIFVALLVKHMSSFGFNFYEPVWWSGILNAFIISVTIIVVAVPEGLPLAVTLSLALNMRRMLKDNNLVRTLSATETIGAATVICSDKTGTLTLNRMKVVSLWNPGQPPGTKCYLPPYDRLMHYLFSVNSTAHLLFEDGRIKYSGNSTEGALLLYLHEHGKDYIKIREGAEIIDRKSFSSDRKMMSTLVNWDEGYNILLVKGAPEIIINKCIGWSLFPDDSVGPIDEIINDFNKIMKDSTNKKQRVLGFAYKLVPKDTKEIKEEDLIFWGLAIIKDPIRRQVKQALQDARHAGVDVKIITGDNLAIAKAISEDLGLLSKNDVILSGEEFSIKKDEEILKILPILRIVARSKPQDKLRLVTLLKQSGEVVAVTGDGTNDAPALRKSDVGIAMGISGTEIAKEASDIVLLDDNFSSIIKGILWGRSLRSNIQKFLQFQLTVNLAALLTAFFGALFGQRSPLTAVQLLWVNLIMDTLAAIGLGLEPPDESLLKEAPKKRDAPLITRYMWFMIFGMGIYVFIVLMILLHINFLGDMGIGSLEHYSVIFTTFVFLQIFNEINARSIRHWLSPFKGLSSSFGFLGILLLIIIIQVILTQFGGELFQTYPLSIKTWIRIIIFSSSTLIVGYVLRRLYAFFDTKGIFVLKDSL